MGRLDIRPSLHVTVVGAALLLLGVAPLPGYVALPGVTATTSGTLVARPAAGDPLEVRLDIALRPRGGGAPLRRYDVDMTKLLHLVIVSDDFGTFLHVHPVLGADGHFTLPVRFPRPALYHLYADATPHGFGRQVFRFDLPVAGGGPAGMRDLAPTGARVAAGPYAVILDRTQLRAGGETRIVVHVRAGGAPARNLHPYLGARAHAVFLNGATLAYVHVHPLGLGDDAMGGMDMPGMAMPAMPAMPELPAGAHVDPAMQLHVDVPAPGRYKLWFQFRGGDALYVAPFVLTAR